MVNEIRNERELKKVLKNVFEKQSMAVERITANQTLTNPEKVILIEHHCVENLDDLMGLLHEKIKFGNEKKVEKIKKEEKIKPENDESPEKVKKEENDDDDSWDDES